MHVSCMHSKLSYRIYYEHKIFVCLLLLLYAAQLRFQTGRSLISVFLSGSALFCKLAFFLCAEQCVKVSRLSVLDVIIYPLKLELFDYTRLMWVCAYYALFVFACARTQEVGYVNVDVEVIRKVTYRRTSTICAEHTLQAISHDWIITLTCIHVQNFIAEVNITVFTSILVTCNCMYIIMKECSQVKELTSFNISNTTLWIKIRYSKALDCLIRINIVGRWVIKQARMLIPWVIV